jgi:hypothetical protein
MRSFKYAQSLFTIKGQILTLSLPQETSQAEKAAAETFSRKLLWVSFQVCQQWPQLKQ